MKRRLLAFLLAFVMTFSLVPVNTFAAEADAAALYTNITTESGENVTVEYVETVVGEAAWGESINTPYYHVTIPEGTGKVLLTYPESVKLVLSGDDGAVFFYRNTYPGQSEIALGGALTVATNDDGSKTVTIPVESFMRSAAGSVAVGMAYYVDGENQSAAEFFDFTYAALTHAVTLTSGEGYTLTGEAAVYHKQTDISRFRRRIPVDQVQHRRQTVPTEIAQEILVLRRCSRRQQRHILPDVRLAGLCAAVPVVQRVAAAQGQDLRRVLLCQPSHPIRPGQSLYVQHGHSSRI